MAIIKCEECGAEISDKAKVCPKCGAPIREEERNEEIYILILIGVGAILFFVGLYLLGTGLSTIMGDLDAHRYTYTSPLTNHEMETMFKTFMGALMFGLGIGTDIVTSIRRKKIKKE